jgi:hypothetical protein
MRRGFSIPLLMAMAFLLASGCDSGPDLKKVAEDAQKTPGPPSGKPPGYSAPNKATGKVKSGPHL